MKTDSSSSRASKSSSNLQPGPSTSAQNETTLILPVDTEKDEMIQKSKRKYDCVSLLQCVNKKIDKLINTNPEKLITKKAIIRKCKRSYFHFLSMT